MMNDEFFNDEYRQIIGAFIILYFAGESGKE